MVKILKEAKHMGNNDVQR
ncbi:hypothetical protein AB3S75_003424 [Citrus x aurantiifolia]